MPSIVITSYACISLGNLDTTRTRLGKGRPQRSVVASIEQLTAYTGRFMTKSDNSLGVRISQ